jgi:hypothetical protein
MFTAVSETLKFNELVNMVCSYALFATKQHKVRRTGEGRSASIISQTKGFRLNVVVLVWTKVSMQILFWLFRRRVGNIVAS